LTYNFLIDDGGTPLTIKKISRRILNAARYYTVPLGALIFFCVIMTIASPNFLKIDNLLNILRQVSINGMLALAMTFVILTGGIDLSVGALLAFTGTLAAGIISKNNFPVPLAIIIALSAGTLVGAINGIIISTSKIAPFIVTLATMNVIRGLAYIYTGGLPIRVVMPSFNVIGQGYIGPIPNPVLYFLILYIILDFMLKRTSFGRHVYSIGDSPDASWFAGINVNRTKFFVYTLTGFITAIAGIVLSSRMYSGQPTAGQGYELDAVAACVLGGASMSGGTGRLTGTLYGALVIGVLNNGLNILNINSFWQLIAKGLVILLALYLDDWKKRSME